MDLIKKFRKDISILASAVFGAVIISMICSTSAFAQQAKDSLTFVNAKWSVEEVAKGITLKQFHFTGEDKIFDSHQYISIIEINSKKAKGRFALASDPGKITPTSKFAKDSGAVVAMNGTFYNMKVPYNCVCYFKKFGVEEFANNEKMAQRDNGAVAISKKGKIKVVPGDAKELGNVLADQTWARAIDAHSVMTSGPMLMYGGKDARLDENSFNRNRHPRSAVAVKGNTVYLITVDGRSADHAQGVSLWELTAIMHYLGVEDAINLDGGGSTTLYVADPAGDPVRDATDESTSGNGVVNHPSDNKKFDNGGERRVVNSLLFINK